MESKVMNPPVMHEAHVVSDHERIIMPLLDVNDIESKHNEEYNSFMRRKKDAMLRFEQAWVCGNSRIVAKISYELDELQLEAKEKGFAY